jgi:hypothetical protein
MVNNVFISVHFYFEIPFLICRTLCWEFIWGGKSRCMLEFRLILVIHLLWKLLLVLKRAALGSKIENGWDTSSFRDWVLRVNLSSRLHLSLLGLIGDQILGACRDRPQEIQSSLLTLVSLNQGPLLIVTSSLGIEEIDACLCNDGWHHLWFLHVWTLNSIVNLLQVLSKRHSNHWIGLLSFPCFSSLLSSEEITHCERHSSELIF